MKQSFLKDEDIFFGFEFADSSREGFISVQPDVKTLLELSGKHPELFSGICPDCGSGSIIFSHKVRTDATHTSVAASTVEYCCPECGKRYSLGANYQLAQLRIDILKAL